MMNITNTNSFHMMIWNKFNNFVFICLGTILILFKQSIANFKKKTKQKN